jgi:hypothetical protein
LGEFPVRKFTPPAPPSKGGAKGGSQPTDPDGNPDTSFLAKIPADVAWTFQTLDRNGLVLNMAQTWHQVRPGEIRHDCGGCHAHSQQPTRFELTAAARPDYPVWDLTRNHPLLTSKKNDQTGKKWDDQDETGVRFASSALSVEYHRDIKPILARSCVACHTRSWEKPAGELVLDDDDTIIDGLPGTYFRLAHDNGQPAGQGKKVQFGPKPVGWIHEVPLLKSYTRTQASRYIRKMQSRRSLLVWKIFGKRLDGFANEDHPSESEPGSGVLMHRGQRIDPGDEKRFKEMLKLSDVDYRGGIMPPPEAVAGTWKGPDGKPIKVEPLTDEDRRTLVRWIDLGCPVDLDFDPKRPSAVGQGLLRDEGQPTLTLAEPRRGSNPVPLTRILVGMHDYDTGLDMDSFTVVADFPIDGVAPGENLASKFQALADQRWELKLAEPITSLPRGWLTVSVKDRQGNTTRIERTFSVGSPAAK